jgi:hypothetical protein
LRRAQVVVRATVPIVFGVKHGVAANSIHDGLTVTFCEYMMSLHCGGVFIKGVGAFGKEKFYHWQVFKFGRYMKRSLSVAVSVNGVH